MNTIIRCITFASVNTNYGEQYLPIDLTHKYQNYRIMKTKHSFGKTAIIRLICISAICFSVCTANAQVTIGSDKQPESGSLLELKEYEATTDNDTSKKGFIYPRVRLTDKSELFPMYDELDTDYITNKNSIKTKHTGLTVYNVKESGVFTTGLHVWNGTEWRKVENSPVIQPQITSLICQSISMTPNSYEQNEPFEGILKVPYLGGNGGTYEETAPVAIGNGLSMERIAGKLAYGGGEAMFRIFGTPTVSSPTTTLIPSIEFLGFTCSNISVGNGAASLNLKNLTNDISINQAFDGNFQTAVTLPFGEINITESGSYAFSLRLYGNIETRELKRHPYYVYLVKNNNSTNTLMDAAEIDVVTLSATVGMVQYQDYSYSVTLAAAFEAGDKVIISMHMPGSLGVRWLLRRGVEPTSPVRTSLVYWKL